MNTRELTVPDASDNDQTPNEIEHVRILLLENIWLLICTSLIGIAVAAYYLKHLPKLYSATAVLQISQRNRVLNFETAAPSPSGSDSEIQTTLELLYSRPLLLEAASNLSLVQDPEFSPPHITLEQAADKLKGILQIKQRKGSQLIDVTATHSSRTLSHKIANAVAEAFLSYQNQHRSDSIRAVMDSLIAESNRLKTRLQQSEETLQTYIEKQNAVSLEEKQDTVTAALKAQANNLVSARSHRIRLQTDLADMDRFRNQPGQLLSIASIAQHPTIVAQRALINDLLSKSATLRLRYTDLHPKQIQARQQLSDAESTLQRITLQIPDTLKAELERALATERSFESALKDQEAQSLLLSRQAISYSVLARDLETDRGLYQSILRRLKETDIERGIPFQNVQILESAQLPAAPHRQKMLQLLVAGLATGLFGGAGAVFLKQASTGSVRSVKAIENTTGLSVLGSIPLQTRPALSGLNPKATPSRSQQSLLEAFRSLRTTLHLNAHRHGKHCFLFTSPLPGEGKSFTATGYATVLANQGLRTLLIDADLRNPSLEHLLLHKGSRPGLIGILENQLPLTAAIVPTNTHNLDLLPAGSPSVDSTELLASQTMNSIISEAKTLYDCIIIDSPPILSVSDSVLLATAVDSICVVTRYAQTPLKALLRTLQLLSEVQAPTEGIILNAVTHRELTPYHTYSRNAQKTPSLLRL